MSLKLSKTNTPAYNYLSEDGAGTNPAVVAVTIDKTGGLKTTSTVTLYLVASNEGGVDIGGYTSITVTPSSSTVGIDWEISTDNTTFTADITPADMDCESADDIITIYARAVCDNSAISPLSTGNYVGEFEIAATENPPAV